MLKRFWLVLAQIITVLVLGTFVVKTLKPQWLPSGLSNLFSINKTPHVLGDKAPIAPREAPRNLSGLSYNAAVKAALPSVVKIDISRSIQKSPFADPSLNQLYNGNQQEEVGGGSGVIIDKQGYVVTNHHVVENAEIINVTLNDGRVAPATIVGSDPETDIAVLKISLVDLPNITLGHDDELQIGDVVLAIGNPFNFGQSVTMGIVSGLNRNHVGSATFENFIQTDAAINQGNSGGALVDSNGHLIGINTAIYNTEGVGNIGIGFAIPVTVVKQVADELIATGTVTRGYIGVSSQNVTPEMARTFNLASQDGVIIASIRPDGPAALAGILVGDILTQVGESPIKDTASMLTEVAKVKPGVQTVVKILRNGQEMNLNVTIGTRPSAVQPR
jgi:serine protease DegQ